MEMVKDFIERVGEETAVSVLKPVWSRPILKRDTIGIHGPLFYRRDHIPTSKSEVDWDSGSINQAQRTLFTQHR